MLEKLGGGIIRQIVLKLRKSRGITIDNLNKGTAWNLKGLI